MCVAREGLKWYQKGIPNIFEAPTIPSPGPIGSYKSYIGNVLLNKQEGLLHTLLISSHARAGRTLDFSEIGTLENITVHLLCARCCTQQSHRPSFMCSNSSFYTGDADDLQLFYVILSKIHKPEWPSPSRESSEFPGALVPFRGDWGGRAGPWNMTEDLDLYPWDYRTFLALVKICLPYLHISMIEHGKRNGEKVSLLLLKSYDLCSHLPEKVPHSTN